MKFLKLEIDTIQNFLYETYNIDYRTTVKKIIKTANAQEKKTLNHHLTLYNLFQLRRGRDPGFFQYVTRIVENDKDTLDNLKQYVEHIIAKHGGDHFSDLFNLNFVPSKSQDDFIINSSLKRTQPQDFDISKLKETINTETQASLKYFQKRYEHSLKIGDYDESAAIVSCMHDYSTHKFFIDELFQDDSIYQGFTTQNIWELERKRFIFQKIRFADIYFDEKNMDNLIFLVLIPISPDFKKNVLRIFQIKRSDSKEIEEDLLIKPSTSLIFSSG